MHSGAASIDRGTYEERMILSEAGRASLSNAAVRRQAEASKGGVSRTV